MTPFTAADLPAQTGRTIVVTGASSGIGRAAARTLADRGAHVVLAVRNPERGLQAAASMPDDVEVRRLDLADLASVRAFAEDLAGPVDVLINNAGVMVPPLSRTADGFELQLGTNHLGHFALTNLLLPRVRDRVVTVASNGHRGGTIDFDDLGWERRPYRPWAAYAQSKLANLLFTTELQRRLDRAGSRVIATAAHPGLAATNLLPAGGHGDGHRFLNALARLVGQPEDRGALPTLHAATADLPGNSYVGPGLLNGRGTPRRAGRSARARDAAVAQRLWEVSESLTGTRFPQIPTATPRSAAGQTPFTGTS